MKYCVFVHYSHGATSYGYHLTFATFQHAEVAAKQLNRMSSHITTTILSLG